MKTLPILIAGGGIAGLSAGLALARLDHACVILEREDRHQEVGAGLQLGPNAVRALQQIGAWDAVEPFTSSPPALELRNGQSGALIRRFDLGRSFEARFAAPYRVCLRADLHRALTQVTQNSRNLSVEMSSVVMAAENRGDGVMCRLGDGRLRHAPRLIAADGVRSAIRQSLFPDAVAVDTDYALHRALAPMLTDVTEAVTLWMCAGGHVVHYPVGQNQQLNIVCTTHRAATPQELAKGCAPDLARLLAAQDWRLWPALHAPALPSWSRGNILLAGDAAHGTLPFLAQGAAMAIEDAAALLSGTFHLDQRMARTARLHRETLKSGHIYHLAGPASKARDLVLSLMPESLFWRRLTWLYGEG